MVKNRESLNKNKIIEIWLLSLLVIMVGLGSIWAFMGHAFMSAQMAAYIGWPAGNPFQLEVAVDCYYYWDYCFLLGCSLHSCHGNH